MHATVIIRTWRQLRPRFSKSFSCVFSSASSSRKFIISARGDEEDRRQYDHDDDRARAEPDTDALEDDPAGVLLPDKSSLKPREVVAELDRFIVGQHQAKRAVAIALRNRWRRHRLPEPLREEVMPKNILMIGPTGCGKTEVARRLAKLANAPFIKVEATKFTEVGFHGRDVDSIIRDLVRTSISLTRQRKRRELKKQIEDAVDQKILDALLGKESENYKQHTMRPSFLKTLKDKQLEKTNITIEVPPPSREDGAGHGGSGNVFLNSGVLLTRPKGDEKRTLPISEARPILERIELEKLMPHEKLIKEAIKHAEEDGIVFIDEIDKIVSNSEFGHRHADASAEGVQRDLLPLIEGSTISTKYGNVETDHILFIASGAFHKCKPSDMLAELQGRLPIRVELKALTEDDLFRILTVPENNLIKQQIALLKTDSVTLKFTDAAIRAIAKVAAEVNRNVENIGARRLHTVIERIVSDISFDACDLPPESEKIIDEKHVQAALAELLQKMDLSKFIL